MKEMIHSFFHLFGLDIIKHRKIQPSGSPAKINSEREIYTIKNNWLKEKNIVSILDIGANTGQFAEKIRWVLPKATIFSFEPIPAVFVSLTENFKNDPNFKAYNLGLGNENGIIDFYLNDYSDSSSFLEMTDLVKANFPIIANENKIQVKVMKLDDVLNITEIKKPFIAKIDVQGFESQVIAGGTEILKNAEYIIVEVSFAELYKKQPLFHSIYNLLRELDFEYVGNFDQLASYVTGEILQADAIFKKCREE